MTSSGLYDAIVLAGRRPGEDPFASAAGVEHRALIPVAGQPMLERVLQVLRRHPRIGSIRISIDRPELLTAGDAAILRAASSPSKSVLDALESRALATTARPVLVTTADHALLDDEILDSFLEAADASESDIAVGLVREALLREAFPDSQRTYLRFRGGGVSGANLFALRTPEARRAVEFWQRVEALRKQPLRLVAAFGPLTLVLFALRLLTLESGFARASKKIGVRASPIPLPFARAAIDVDKPADLELVERILAGQRPAG